MATKSVGQLLPVVNQPFMTRFVQITQTTRRGNYVCELITSNLHPFGLDI